MRRWVRKHRTWATVVVFGVFLVAAFFIYRTLFDAGTSQEVRYVAQAAENGTLVVSVSGTGNAALGSSYDVTPSVSGVVRGLSVEVGDVVTAGQVLFTLENDQLDMSVISAQASVDQARASLLNAEANVAQAEQSLEQLEEAYESGGNSGGSTTSTTRPPATLPTTTLPPTTTVPSSTTLPPTTLPPTTSGSTTTTGPFPGTTSSTGPPSGTTSTSDVVTTAPPTSTTVPPTLLPPTTAWSPTTTSAASLTAEGASPVHSGGVVAALGSADPAAAPVEALSAPEAGDTSGTGGTTAQGSNAVTATDIAVAKKKVAAAEASLSASQANLQTAQYNLDRAQADAAARTVTAPAAGVVTVLNVAEGAELGSTGSSGAAGGEGAATGATSASSSSSSSSTALTIVDADSLCSVVQLMESDIPQIEVGQKATLSFDALPDLTLAAKVTAVDFVGTNSQGVVTFNVTVTPDTTDEHIRPGMTSYASIVTAVRQDVVLVPSSAVKTASGGGSYVEVLVNGVPEQRNVTLGLTGDTQNEIVAGLQAGEEVVTQTVDPNATATTARSGGGFGIGGGFPGAGGPGR